MHVICFDDGEAGSRTMMEGVDLGVDLVKE